MATITPVSKNDVMEENEKKSVVDGLSLRKWGFRNNVSAGNEGKEGGGRSQLLSKNPKKRGFRNGVRDAENTCIYTKA
ncbi:hypothetical protein TNCV_1028791 [Trichonephila clavipes]|nr:hypothetical protein TNCV_1028791 [Trichonephila clavipes]